MNQPRMNNNTSRMNNNTSRMNNQSLLNNLSHEKMSPIVIFIVVLILLVLVYIIINYIYNQIVSARPIQVKENVLVDVVTDGMTEIEIGSNQLPHSSYSNEYSLSLWVNVDNFDYKHGERKYILRRGDIRSKVNPEIYLHPTQNTLQVNVSLSTDSHNTSHTTSIPLNTPHDTTTTTSSTPVLPEESTTSAEGFTSDVNINDFAERNISTVSDDKFVHNIANNYDNTFFNDVVNTNKVNYKSTPSVIKALKHSPELNLVLEQFNDNETNVDNCDCSGKENDKLSESERLAFEEKCGKCFVEHFPLQKWVHLVISQYNNVIDIYVDGKLYSSCVLQGFPDVSTENLVLSPDGGFSGQMSSVVHFNSALSQDDVYRIYIKGPEGSRNTGVVQKLRNIPTWYYYIFVLLVVGAVVYSLLM